MNFQIVGPDGQRLSASVIDGRIAVYNADDTLIGIYPNDLESIRSLGTIKASDLVRARLILEAGTDSPGAL